MQKEQFGILLTTLRKKNGISQKEMAERLSVSTSAVSKWEHGKNLPDMTMLGSIAETLQVSCDELLNPEKTLERLANPEPQKEALSKKKHRRIVKIVVLVGILVIAAGLLLGYMVKHREPTFQQIGTRYIDDPDWGYTYEISYVVKGEVTGRSINEYLDEVRNEMDWEELGTNVVKTSYYRNREDALAWKETDMRGYTFLNVE